MGKPIDTDKRLIAIIIICGISLLFCSCIRENVYVTFPGNDTSPSLTETESKNVITYPFLNYTSIFGFTPVPTHTTPDPTFKTNIPDTPPTVPTIVSTTPYISETPGISETPVDTFQFLDNWVNDKTEFYLSTNGIFEVGSKKNVIVFIIDRLDLKYFNEMIQQPDNPCNDMNGFVFFPDNISLYARTFPAICSMVTGIDDDFSTSRSKYFRTAYTESDFLKDMRGNDFTIKIYSQQYYVYNIYSCMHGNIYNAVDKSKNPDIYEIDDGKLIADFRSKGLSVGDYKNSMAVYHLNGCHTPGQVDENGIAASKQSSVTSLKGCLRFINEYISEMKRLGVYDDSTIIITGDHPDPISDYKLPSTPRLTALLVKKPKASFSGIRINYAQVSQENFIPTIVELSGIRTTHQYGKTYFDIDPNEDQVRIHKFERNIEAKEHVISLYEIKGKGTDFNNWYLKEEIKIGNLYN